jgi:hypothetical protein
MYYDLKSINSHTSPSKISDDEVHIDKYMTMYVMIIEDVGNKCNKMLKE